MGLISFFSFCCKTAFDFAKLLLTSHSCFSLFDINYLEIANCSNKSIVFYLYCDFLQALFVRSCHEDVILTKKSHNCTGTAFFQGNSAGGSRLIDGLTP